MNKHRIVQARVTISTKQMSNIVFSAVAMARKQLICKQASAAV